MAELSPESGRFIDEIVASGRFKSRDGAIDEAVRLLRSEIQRSFRKPADSLTAQEWCDRFEKWAASHRRLAHEADDSRESIYLGRGE
jgi:Arc/MetJ-type ribon-helix-helix transcriptional regulator